MKKYETFYDFTFHTMNFHWLIGLVFMLIGFGISFNSYLTNKKIFNYQGFAGILFFVFATLWTVMVGYSEFQGHFQVNRIINEKSFKVVEGKIENFEPMPSGGHAMENFIVNGVYFEYADGVLINGFHQTKVNGGPIQGNDEKVRISYYAKNGKNYIIKLEKLMPTQPIVH